MERWKQPNKTTFISSVWKIIIMCSIAEFPSHAVYPRNKCNSIYTCNNLHLIPQNNVVQGTFISILSYSSNSTSLYNRMGLQRKKNGQNRTE